MIKIKQLNKFMILFLMILLNLQCFKTPEGAFKTVDNFFQLRNQGAYGQQYNLFHENFKKNVSIENYIEVQKIYRKGIGQLKEYKLKKRSERKNFSCGRGSGRMVALIYDCIYTNRNAEETFTMIKVDDKWEIFDYYLRPM